MRLSLPVALLISTAALAEDLPAPALHFAADTVLAGGHVLAEAVELPAKAGPVVLTLREGASLRWHVVVENGETRLMQPDGRWAAKAEYYRAQRGDRIVCQIYQTTISPEWATMTKDSTARADYTPADDRIYAFREAPCP
ncbi:hypothetical protein [Ferrovibrio terrae]|uniref:hypothetical protein n=1 Tax=Ferrovibrio terrae TaxID=2594003 RepID=UPI00313834FF